MSDKQLTLIENKNSYFLESTEFLFSIEQFKKCAMPFEIWVKNKTNQNVFVLSWCRTLEIAFESVDQYLEAYYRERA
jgi:hypothetical protein